MDLPAPKNHGKPTVTWEDQYLDCQETLYTNLFTKSILNVGHYWIARQNYHYWLGKNGTKNVLLDFGCGIGHHIKFENPKIIKDYVCLDKRADMLDRIEDKPFIKKLISDGTQIALPDESIDSVIASHILEHVPNLKEVVKELRRVLKRGGLFLVALPCDPGFMWNALANLSPNRRKLNKLGLDYQEVMSLEHVHDFKDILLVLNKLFARKAHVFIPFPVIRCGQLNLVYCARLEKL